MNLSKLNLASHIFHPITVPKKCVFYIQYTQMRSLLSIYNIHTLKRHYADIYSTRSVDDLVNRTLCKQQNRKKQKLRLSENAFEVTRVMAAVKISKRDFHQYSPKITHDPKLRTIFLKCLNSSF